MCWQKFGEKKNCAQWAISGGLLVDILLGAWGPHHVCFTGPPANFGWSLHRNKLQVLQFPGSSMGHKVTIHWMFRGLEVVSLMFCELSKIILRKYIMSKITCMVEFEAEILYACPKPCFGHTYKVLAWNSHKKYDFCNTQISREYLGELVKR